MNRRDRRRRTGPPFRVEITDADIMESLSWPHPPPGAWRVPRAETRHIDDLLRGIERRGWPLG